MAGITLEQGIALASLGYKPFEAAIKKWLKERKMKATKDELSTAYRELLKGDAADMAVVAAALETAKQKGDTSADHIKLRSAFDLVGAGGGARPGKKHPPVAKKKTAGKTRGKKVAKKKSNTRKCGTKK